MQDSGGQSRISPSATRRVGSQPLRSVTVMPPCSGASRSHQHPSPQKLCTIRGELSNTPGDCLWADPGTSRSHLRRARSFAAAPAHLSARRQDGQAREVIYPSIASRCPTSHRSLATPAGPSAAVCVDVRREGEPDESGSPQQKTVAPMVPSAHHTQGSSATAFRPGTRARAAA